MTAGALDSQLSIRGLPEDAPARCEHIKVKAKSSRMVLHDPHQVCSRGMCLPEAVPARCVELVGHGVIPSLIEERQALATCKLKLKAISSLHLTTLVPLCACVRLPCPCVETPISKPLG